MSDVVAGQFLQRGREIVKVITRRGRRVLIGHWSGLLRGEREWRDVSDLHGHRSVPPPALSEDM